MPIGVFDSGLGGLTVLSTLRDRFPDQAFVYLGDAANAPYGARSARQITDLTISSVQRLFDDGCGLVILACNTASAVALKPMQDYFVPADRRVLGVLVPLVEAVAGRTWMQTGAPGAPAISRVVFFGTPATVISGTFPREVRLRAVGVDILQIPCPGLVDALEAGAQDVAEALVAEFTTIARAEMPDAEAMILGCTHYPLVRDAFQRGAPKDARLLDQGMLVADSLAAYLDRHPRFRQQGDVVFKTTGSVDQVARAAQTFLRCDVPVRFVKA